MPPPASRYDRDVPPSLEIFLAAAIPIAAFAWISGRYASLRPLRLTAVLVTCLWAAPMVLTSSTDVSLDFLAEEFPNRATPGPRGLTKNPLINDVVLQFLPWREAVRQSILAGELPLLDRASGGGTPLLANPQAGAFYLPNLVALPLSTFGWPLFVSVTKLLIALSGTFLFLRRCESSEAAARFGAIAYAFSTFTAAYLMFPHTNVTTLFPWLLLSIDGVIDDPGPRTIASGAFVTGLVLISGHPESAFHCAMAAVPYALYRVVSSGAYTALARLALTAFLAAGLSAVALLPFITYLPHAQRLHDIASSPGFLSTPPLDRAAMVTLLIPNYYGNPRVHNYRHALNFNELSTQYAGLATLALAILGLLTRRRHRVFWMITAALSFMLANQPPGIASILERVPLLDITAHGRMRFIFTFALVVLAAFGFDTLRERARARTMIGVSLLVLVIGICLLSYPAFAAVGVRRLIFFTEAGALASVALLLAFPRVPRAQAILTGLLVADLFSITGYYNPAVGAIYDYPSTPMTRALLTPVTDRFVGIGRVMMANIAVFHSVEDIRPHDPMAFRPYGALLDAAGFDRSHYFGRFNTLPPRVLLDFLGVSRVAAAPGSTFDLPIGYAGADGVVFMNPTALARFFVPRAVAVSGDPARALLASNDALVVHASAAQPLARAVIQLERYSPSASQMHVTATGETLIASSEVALPGWTLKRNGAEWPLEQINGGFLAWRAPAGESSYTLRYTSPGLRSGAAISMIALLLVLALRWQKQRKLQ